MQILKIGQVAKASGVGIETIRFYEREGLIDNPPRRASGYRQYPENVVDRLQFIRHAKELGFTLKEIHGLLSLRVDPDATCAEVKERADAKIADVTERIRSLQRIKRTLIKIVQSCDGKGPAVECPILEALDPHAEE